MGLKIQDGPKYTKWPQNVPKFSVPKIYLNCDFWYANIPSGNPGCMPASANLALNLARSKSWK
jgi:hypothetical protein